MPLVGCYRRLCRCKLVVKPEQATQLNVLVPSLPVIASTGVGDAIVGINVLPHTSLITGIAGMFAIVASAIHTRHQEEACKGKAAQKIKAQCEWDCYGATFLSKKVVQEFHVYYF